MSLFCPLIKSECMKDQCAWWSWGDQSCAVVGLKIEMVKLQETLESSGKPFYPAQERTTVPQTQLPMVANVQEGGDTKNESTANKPKESVSGHGISAELEKLFDGENQKPTDADKIFN